MKLSIVIPVFRVEQTLARCIDSVLGQSFRDYEVVLVDDGSPDASGEICDEYARRDSRIRVIHQGNGGLSDARNTGIDAARGEYITFVDSDDFLDSSTYQPLMDTLNVHPEYDLLEYPVFERYGSPMQRMLTFEDKAYHDMNAYWLETHAYAHTYACNKIYRRTLFSNVRFPKGRVFEDVWVLPQLLRQATTVGTTGEGLYFYTHNPQGITVQADGKALNDLLEAHMRIFHPQTTDEKYYAHLLNIQMDVYERTGQQPILPEMPFHGTIKLRLLQFIGMKRICQLNKILHKWIKPSR